VNEAKQRFPDVSMTNAVNSAVPGLKANTDSTIENLLMTLSGTNKVEAVSFATEAGIFQAHTIPAIVCGPGSIMQAHKPNEFIETSQLEACIGFVQKLVSAVNG
jgi:acetylornithine deacetylase